MLYKFVMGLLVVALFALAVGLSEWRDRAFQEKIDKADARLAAMTAEHEASMKAAQKAMEQREAILEREKEKLCAAQAAMGLHPDFCSIAIPDDLRLWENAPNDADGADTLPPAGKPARAD